MERLAAAGDGGRRRWCLAALTGVTLLLTINASLSGQDDPFNPKAQAEKKDAKQPAPKAAEDDPFQLNLKKKEEAAKEKADEKKPKAPATASRIDFEVRVEPKKARRGETVKLTINGKPRPGLHTYPITQRTPNQNEFGLSSLKFAPSPVFKPLPPLKEEPKPEPVVEAGDVYLEYKKPFTWSQDILVLPEAKPGKHSLQFSIRLQVCDTRCVWGTHTFEEPIEVLDEVIPVTPQLQARLQEPPPEIQVVDPKTGNPKAKPDNGNTPVTKNTGLASFVLAGIFWGAVSLITPCVFPMIPITVSFFLKQSEKQHHKPITMALVYCATIIVVLTIAAVTLLSFFRWLSVNPVMNIALGGLFVFFALSLFGMYEIELPSGLARFTSAHEGQGGLLGTMFMALTFTIISFACVAPFLGGFGGTADTAQMTLLHRILGGLAFSLTFASPFFVLALFPTLLKKMPKSGNWLNSVKVVMGFLELAAALKFFRAGELVMLPRPQLFTYDLVLGFYVALSVACGLYLLNMYRLPHDTPSDHLSVPQLMFSLVFLGLALYLTPALFKTGNNGQSQRPNGAVFAWLDSFLLPDPHESDLPWKGNLQDGLREALAKHKLVFVDFTGKTCTNCKINEREIFPRPLINALMKKYVLVQMYTDVVPNEFYPPEQQAEFGTSTAKQRADAETNLEFQKKFFDTEQLPLYVILKPLPGGKFEEVARYEEGKINNEIAFATFLKKPLDGVSDIALRAD